MDVDSVNASLPFKKLTDNEHTKYRSEGRCFRCRETGHMARNCPKNNDANNSNRANPKARKSTTSLPIVTTTTMATTTPPPVPPKLSYGQQIRALEEKMTEEEHAIWARIFALPGFEGRNPGNPSYHVQYQRKLNDSNSFSTHVAQKDRNRSPT